MEAGSGEREGILSGSDSFRKVPDVEKYRTYPGISLCTKPTSCPPVQVKATEGPEQAEAAMIGPDGG